MSLTESLRVPCQSRLMKELDDLLMTFFVAAVIVSPLADLGALLAPAEAHGLLLAFASAWA